MGYGFSASANFSNLTEDDQFLDQLNDNKGHSVNMNVSIPIFNRNQTKAQVKKSKIQEETSNLALDQVKVNLESTIQRAFTDAKAALKAFEAAQLSLESQELALLPSPCKHQSCNLASHVASLVEHLLGTYLPLADFFHTV